MAAKKKAKVTTVKRKRKRPLKKRSTPAKRKAKMKVKMTEAQLAKYKPTKQKRMYANKLRRSMSPPEGRIWHRLRYEFGDVEWFTQSIVLGYVADFFCPLRRIVVEVDSSFHIGREKEDAERDKAMERYGITVVRIEASDINRNISACLCKILDALSETEDNPWPAKFT